MGLHDVDKGSLSRSRPGLNADDGQPVESVKAHATEAIAYRDRTGEIPRVISKDDQIIVFDGNFNKGLFGRDGAGNYVVKIAKDGFDVLTATDDELIFNSAQNVFKIVDIGFGEAPAVTASLDATNTYTGSAANLYGHGLGYVPLVIAFIDTGGSLGVAFEPMPYTVNYSLGGTGGIGIVKYTVRVTDNDISIRTNIIEFGPAAGTTSTTAANIKYYLLQETAN